MPVKKIAISVPMDVLQEVDEAAKERGETRSGFISKVLAKVARIRSDRRITGEIDQLFEDEELSREQRESAAAFARMRGGSKGLEW